MILIAHKANTHGVNSQRENTLSYIQEALDAGYNVECDIWFKDNQFWLGHDAPGTERLSDQHLYDSRLWLHCKDITTLFELDMFKNKIRGANYFFHQNDDCAIVFGGILWTFPGKKLTPLSIAVKPEGLYTEEELKNCAGICSDYISKYKYLVGG